MTKVKSDSREYTASNIVSASFTPDNQDAAPVKCILDNEKHYVCFYPDTTESKQWRDFQSRTGEKWEAVGGFVSLTDKWGVTTTLPVNMTWYNAYEMNKDLSVTLDDEDLYLGDDAYYTYNLTDEFEKLGLVDRLKKDTRYGLTEYWSRLTAADLGEVTDDGMTLQWPEDPDADRIATLFFNKPGTALQVGDKYRVRGRFRLTVNPSDNTPNFTPTQVLVSYCITVNIIESL